MFVIKVAIVFLVCVVIYGATPGSKLIKSVELGVEHLTLKQAKERFKLNGYDN